MLIEEKIHLAFSLVGAGTVLFLSNKHTENGPILKIFNAQKVNIYDGNKIVKSFKDWPQCNSFKQKLIFRGILPTFVGISIGSFIYNIPNIFIKPYSLSFKALLVYQSRKN